MNHWRTTSALARSDGDSSAPQPPNLSPIATLAQRRDVEERDVCGRAVVTTPYGNPIPELDVPKLFVLEPSGRHDLWWYTRSRQGPEHGTLLEPGPGLVSLV